MSEKPAPANTIARSGPKKCPISTAPEPQRAKASLLRCTSSGSRLSGHIRVIAGP